MAVDWTKTGKPLAEMADFDPIKPQIPTAEEYESLKQIVEFVNTWIPTKIFRANGTGIVVTEPECVGVDLSRPASVLNAEMF